MSDGDNKAGEAALAHAKAEITKLEAELAKQVKITENAEAKFNEWAAERGNERKAVGEVANELAAASKKLREAVEDQVRLREDLAEAQRKLVEAEKGKPKPTEGNGNNRGTDTGSEKSAAEIEAALTADEQKALDDAWKKASEEQRVAVKGNENSRKAFLLKAKEAVAVKATTDLADWRTTLAKPKSVSPGGDDELDLLFGLKKQSAEDYPDGSQGGVTRRRRAAEVSAIPPGVRKASWISGD
jgi:hypothetical protein